MKGAHHRGTYQRRARALVQRANRAPSTKCWRCGKLLADHRAHRDGRPAFWTAGHVIDSDPNSILMAEASICNFAAGARLKNQRAKRRNGNPQSRRWFT
jgi:hypothetical protein